MHGIGTYWYLVAYGRLVWRWDCYDGVPFSRDWGFPGIYGGLTDERAVFGQWIDWKGAGCRISLPGFDCDLDGDRWGLISWGFLEG